MRILCSIHLGSVKAYFLEGFSTFINTKIRMDALGHESRTVPTDWRSFFTPQRLPNLPKQQHQVNVPVSRAPNALALPRWECELSWSEPNSSPHNTKRKTSPAWLAWLEPKFMRFIHPKQPLPFKFMSISPEVRDKKWQGCSVEIPSLLCLAAKLPTRDFEEISYSSDLSAYGLCQIIHDHSGRTCKLALCESHRIRWMFEHSKGCGCMGH